MLDSDAADCSVYKLLPLLFSDERTCVSRRQLAFISRSGSYAAVIVIRRMTRYSGAALRVPCGAC